MIGSANNVNDQGFSGGGGGPRWRRNNGLVATKTLGANFATETSKLELDGSVRYDYKGADIISTNSSERFLQNGSSYSNSNAVNKNKNSDVFAVREVRTENDIRHRIRLPLQTEVGKDIRILFLLTAFELEYELPFCRKRSEELVLIMSAPL